MTVNRRRSSAFHRIGDRYSHFFDFDHFMGRNAFDDSWVSDPRSKTENGKKYYKIDLALPGFTKKDINVQVHENTLSVQIVKNGKKSEDVPGKDEHVEIGKRYYRLPNYLNQDDIRVKYRNGVLKIRIPYKEGVQPEQRKVKVV